MVGNLRQEVGRYLHDPENAPSVSVVMMMTILYGIAHTHLPQDRCLQMCQIKTKPQQKKNRGNKLGF